VVGPILRCNTTLEIHKFTTLSLATPEHASFLPSELVAICTHRCHYLHLTTEMMSCHLRTHTLFSGIISSTDVCRWCCYRW